MKSIAIIGASANHEKFGNKCVRAYKKLGWQVFPINPKEKGIEGFTSFQSIKDLPQKPDRVSIYLPPQVSLSIIPDLVAANIGQVILNPGAQSGELVAALKNSGIKSKLVCSIRLEGLSPDDFP